MTKQAYAEPEYVTEGTTLTPERNPGDTTASDDAESAPAFTDPQRAAMEESLRREDATGLLPRHRFLDALDGRIPMERYTSEALKRVTARAAEYRRQT
jgi:hypothetical protein